MLGLLSELFYPFTCGAWDMSQKHMWASHSTHLRHICQNILLSWDYLLLVKEAGLTLVHLHGCQAVKKAASRKQPKAGAISPVAEEMTREMSLFKNSECSILYCLSETTQKYQICSRRMFKSCDIQLHTDHWQILKDKHVKFFTSPHTAIPSNCTTALKCENQVHRGYHSEESHCPSEFLKDLVGNTGLNVDKMFWKITSARLGQNFRFHENYQLFLSLWSDVTALSPWHSFFYIILIVLYIYWKK